MVSVAKSLWEVLSIFGVPKIIQSDNGTEFVNELVKNLTTLNGISHRTISPYNPRANGAVERVNGTIETMLLKELNGAMHQWDAFLPYVQLAYNNKIAALTGSTPFSLMFGRQLNEFKKHDDGKTGGNINLLRWKNSQKMVSEIIYPTVKKRVLNVKEKDARDFARSKRIIGTDAFPPGAKVMMYDSTKTSKWDARYEGPFTVVRKNRGGAYVLRDELGRLKRAVPADQLKLVWRYQGEPAVEENVHEVKKVTDHRSEKNGKLSCFVVWKDPSIKPGWEPVENFNDVDIIRSYWKSARPTRRSKKNNRS